MHNWKLVMVMLRITKIMTKNKNEAGANAQ